MPDDLQAESTDIQRSQDIMNYISISDYYYATQKMWRREQSRESCGTQRSKIILNKYQEEKGFFKYKASWKQVEKICRGQRNNFYSS